MTQPESQTRQSPSIDALSSQSALQMMLASQLAAARAVSGAIPAIAAAADLVAATLGQGRHIVYVAAGSSGLMALADACELPGTFGIPQEQIHIFMAGGVPSDGRMPGDTEDRTDAAVEIASGMRPGDVAIVVSASGTTPFACAAAEEIRRQGHKVVGIANVAEARLLNLADIAIAIPTGREVIDGSTRLGAGTAQKVALNMISTQVGILLGHVHDGLMVNLNPDNIKLRKRAAGIVGRIAGVSEQAATQALQEAEFNTKLAVLIAKGASAEEAQTLLDEHDHRLRDCLACL